MQKFSFCRTVYPQVSGRNSCELLEDPNEDRINSVAEQLGLRRVGWIFTDLIAQDLKTGTVKHFRGNIVSFIINFLIESK